MTTKDRSIEAFQTHSETTRGMILECLEHLGDATADEIAETLGLFSQSVSPRCSELAKSGVIVDSGEVRPTRCGKNATVWKHSTITTEKKRGHRDNS